MFCKGIDPETYFAQTLGRQISAKAISRSLSEVGLLETFGEKYSEHLPLELSTLSDGLKKDLRRYYRIRINVLMDFLKSKYDMFTYLRLPIYLMIKNQNGEDDEDREKRWAEEQEKGGL